MANYDGPPIYGRAQCAHTRVSPRRRMGMMPNPIMPGHQTEAVVAEWWECDNGCGMTFSPDVKPLRVNWWRRIRTALSVKRVSSEGKA